MWEFVPTSLRSIVCIQSIYFRIGQRRPTKAAAAIDDITITPCSALPLLTTTSSISTIRLIAILIHCIPRIRCEDGSSVKAYE